MLNKIYDRGGFRGRGIDWGATHSLLEKQKIEKKKMKKIVNIMTEIKANTLDRFLIVISTFWCNSFTVNSISQIATFCGHASLIL